MTRNVLALVQGKLFNGITVVRDEQISVWTTKISCGGFSGERPVNTVHQILITL